MILNNLENMKYISFDEYFNNWKPSEEAVIIEMGDDLGNSKTWLLDKDLFDVEEIEKEEKENVLFGCELGIFTIGDEDIEKDKMVIIDKGDKVYAVIKENKFPPTIVLTSVLMAFNALLDLTEGE